ncbi:MAG: hypothetical protein Q4F41_02495 [Eubacteriales bacterium]|nr:hypothetical protein [Eubacteriales bacterium]
MKKKLRLWMLLAVLVCASWAQATTVGQCASSTTVSKNYTGWKTVGKKKYYYRKGQMVKNKWTVISGEKYHFAKNGVLDTSKWVGNRYVDKTGKYVKEAVKGKWVKTPIGTRYKKSNGTYLGEGKYYIDGYYYMMDGNGYLWKNTWIANGNRWYYCGKTGKVATNKWISAKTHPADAYWDEFFKSFKYLWVNEKGELEARKNKTVKWDQVLEVFISASTKPVEGKVREGYYYIQPKKGKTAYYQWVKKTGNTFDEYRPVVKVTKKVKVAFGRGDADNPWCIQLYNCKLTRIES